MAHFDVQVNLDSSDPDALMEFWTQVLGYERRGAAGPYIAAADPEGIGPRLVVQRVPEGKVTKNRLHLDLYVESAEAWHAEIERVTSLGATPAAQGPMSQDDDHWLVLTDPEGNEFCICHDATS